MVLKRSREITADVEEKWKATAEFRLNELYRKCCNSRRNTQRAKKKRKDSNSGENNQPDFASEYFEEFKILKQPQGYKLVSCCYFHILV